MSDYWRKKEELISDLITTAFEEAVYKKKLSRSECNGWYQYLGSRCRLFDLIPRIIYERPDPAVLKQQIKDRLVSYHPQTPERSIIMAHHGVILQRKKGQTVADALLEKILEQYPNAVGFAMADTGESITTFKEAATGTLADLKEMQEACDTNLTWWFCKSDGAIHADDLQPFTVIEAEFETEDGTATRPLLVAFIDGDFIGYYQKDSAHSNEFFVFNKTLREEILSSWEDAGQDLDVLMKELDHPRFRRNLQKILGPRGEIVLMAANGEVQTFSVNNKAKNFEWGRVSDALGYGEPVKEEPATVSSKPLTMREKLELAKKNRATAPVEAKPVAAPTGPKIPDTPKTDTAIPAAAGKAPTEEMIAIPPDLDGRDKAKKKWWGRNFIDRPHDFLSRKVYPVSKLRPGSPLAPRNGMQDVAKAVEAQSEAVDARIIPIIAPGQIKQFNDVFMPSMKLAKQYLDKPETIKELEEKYPTIEEQMPTVKLKDMIMWSFSAYREICRTHPQIGAVILNDLRTKLYEVAPQLFQEEKKEEEVAPKQPQTMREKMEANKAKRVVL